MLCTWGCNPLKLGSVFLYTPLYCAVAVNSLNMDIYTVFNLCNFQVSLHYSIPLRLVSSRASKQTKLHD